MSGSCSAYCGWRGEEGSVFSEALDLLKWVEEVEPLKIKLALATSFAVLTQQTLAVSTLTHTIF